MKRSRSIFLGALAAGGLVLGLGSPASADCDDEEVYLGDDDWDGTDWDEAGEGGWAHAYDDDDLHYDNHQVNEDWTVAHVGHFSRNQEWDIHQEWEDESQHLKASHSIFNVVD
jgi:hypothetical protein